jgi:hypothetical protein
VRARVSIVVAASSLIIVSALLGCSTTQAGPPGNDGAAGAACIPSGADGGSGSIPPTFATVRLVLGGGGAIMPCASAPCHAAGGTAPPGNPLSLQDTPQLYATMTSYVAKECGNMRLVSPGKPDESALIKILKGPCGVVPRMPYMCSDDACIPDDYIAALSRWIANCAPEQ